MIKLTELLFDDVGHDESPQSAYPTSASLHPRHGDHMPHRHL